MSDLDRLLQIMARLRDPEGGCPWDVEQDFASIAPFTIEEAYEVADAIERQDMAALKDELGDLLFQVVFHAQMASEQGAFAFADVVEAVCDKMVRRHPHVFGDADISDAAAQTLAWEEQKARERAAGGNGRNGVGESALAGVAKGLPALLRAHKLQNRAARVGFDWPEAGGALEKLKEEIGELDAELATGGGKDKLLDELGDVLFSAVNLARKLGLDAEAALRHGNTKFEERYRAMEAKLADDGVEASGASLETMEAAWQASKNGAAK